MADLPQSQCVFVHPVYDRLTAVTVCICPSWQTYRSHSVYFVHHPVYGRLTAVTVCICPSYVWQTYRSHSVYLSIILYVYLSDLPQSQCVFVHPVWQTYRSHSVYLSILYGRLTAVTVCICPSCMAVTSVAIN